MSEKKPKKEKTWYRESLIQGAMKKVWHHSPMYKAIKDAAKVPYTAKNKDGSDSKAHRVKYRCAICMELFKDGKELIEITDKRGKKKLKKITLIQVDHVSPVINPNTGFIGYAEWIERQFVGFITWDPKKNSVKDLDGKVQVICHFCHAKKSALENSIRRENKKE